jgi:hypothetical protein
MENQSHRAGILHHPWVGPTIPTAEKNSISGLTWNLDNFSMEGFSGTKLVEH